MTCPESPLEGSQFHPVPFAEGDIRFRKAAVLTFDADTLLKGYCNVYLFGFDDAVGTDRLKKFDGFTTTQTPCERRGKGEPSVVGVIYATPEAFFQEIQRSPVYLSYSDAQLPDRTDRASVLHGLLDLDASLSIKEAGEVDVHVHEGPRKVSGELGEHPMPGPLRDAEGQSRTKQAERPGVRREQVRTPTGKVCSELGGNVENEVETASSYVGIIPHRVTDSYQRTCNVPVRFVRPGGQGGSADVTWESLEYMGRPWYWDRQCPTGRAYFLRNDDTFFMVDPRFLFKWTGDLTYPDQMAFTRLCGVRFFLCTQRRMFQAVIDGVTA